MSKAILVVDMPKDCFTCELGGSKVCIGGCPLKPMPQFIWHEEGKENECEEWYKNGWNACLEEIENG